MFKQLTNEQITKLASKPKVRKVAVENFLGTLFPGPTMQDHLYNLQMDAGLYKWNAPTVAAIREGILMAFRD